MTKDLIEEHCSERAREAAMLLLNSRPDAELNETQINCLLAHLWDESQTCPELILLGYLDKLASTPSQTEMVMSVVRTCRAYAVNARRHTRSRNYELYVITKNLMKLGFSDEDTKVILMSAQLISDSRGTYNEAIEELLNSDMCLTMDRFGKSPRHIEL